MTDLYPALPIKAAGTNEIPNPPSLGHISHEDGIERSNNYLRAVWAGVGLHAYARRVGDVHEPFEAAISDLLADLMHLVDALREGDSLQEDYWAEYDTREAFDRMLDQARRRYNEELRGEP